MRSNIIRLTTAFLIGGLLVSGMVYGQRGGRGGGGGTTWIDDTHYVDLQKGKGGKDIKMSVDAATGKAKLYAPPVEALLHLQPEICMLEIFVPPYLIGHTPVIQVEHSCFALKIQIQPVLQMSTSTQL